MEDCATSELKTLEAIQSRIEYLNKRIQFVSTLQAVIEANDAFEASERKALAALRTSSEDEKTTLEREYDTKNDIYSQKVVVLQDKLQRRRETLNDVLLAEMGDTAQSSEFVDVMECFVDEDAEIRDQIALFQQQINEV